MTMTLAFFFEGPAAVLNWLYEVTGSYMTAISLTAVIVMAIVTPLTLKSTKGMLEMQRLAPEMRRGAAVLARYAQIEPIGRSSMRR